MISRVEGLSDEHKGVLYAVIAHLFWGAMAFYFGLIRYVNPLEIAANRAIWSIPIGLFMVWRLGLLDAVWRVLTNPKLMAIFCLTSFLVVFNWTLYIWCITNGRTLDASLGYFINPLLNVAVGYIFLGERFTKPQMIAIAMAVVAVIVVTVGTGVFPVIGLSLGGTFCLYGLVRKTMPVGAVEGFTIEVILTSIPLFFIELYLWNHGQAYFGTSTYNTLMLLGCGAFTAGALLFYSTSLRLIRYSTVGILQYLSPSIVFLTAVFVFGEHLDKWKLIAFSIIWLACAIYSVSAILDERAKSASLDVTAKAAA
ncbi:EamA family transporter RarD [Aestuariivirga litoralis]|uniref:EamA family transporter RarD n=1 Tax=Aestuariivirga litoralis TaxID=2650924 RepID=UPI0018C6A3C0|nr:EamA family transporter RarD [Aestuariivirga litoralis]MBG1232079.1 EamA family transporter RarD [Aestuariivirga litoralis]